MSRKVNPNIESIDKISNENIEDTHKNTNDDADNNINKSKRNLPSVRQSSRFTQRLSNIRLSTAVKVIQLQSKIKSKKRNLSNIKQSNLKDETFTFSQSTSDDILEKWLDFPTDSKLTLFNNLVLPYRWLLWTSQNLIGLEPKDESLRERLTSSMNVLGTAAGLFLVIAVAALLNPPGASLSQPPEQIYLDLFGIFMFISASSFIGYIAYVLTVFYPIAQSLRNDIMFDAYERYMRRYGGYELILFNLGLHTMIFGLVIGCYVLYSLWSVIVIVISTILIYESIIFLSRECFLSLDPISAMHLGLTNDPENISRAEKLSKFLLQKIPNNIFKSKDVHQKNSSNSSSNRFGMNWKKAMKKEIEDLKNDEDEDEHEDNELELNHNNENENENEVDTFHDNNEEDNENENENEELIAHTKKLAELALQAEKYSPRSRMRKSMESTNSENDKQPPQLQQSSRKTVINRPVFTNSERNNRVPSDPVQSQSQRINEQETNRVSSQKMISTTINLRSHLLSNDLTELFARSVSSSSSFSSKIATKDCKWIVDRLQEKGFHSTRQFLDYLNEMKIVFPQSCSCRLFQQFLSEQQNKLDEQSDNDEVEEEGGEGGDGGEDIPDDASFIPLSNQDNDSSKFLEFGSLHVSSCPQRLASCWVPALEKVEIPSHLAYQLIIFLRIYLK